MSSIDVPCPSRIWVAAALAALLGAGCSGDEPGGGEGPADTRDGGPGEDVPRQLPDASDGSVDDTRSSRDSGSPGFDVSFDADGDVSAAPTPRIWWLKRGATEWSVFDRGGRPARHAPEAPIRAAFDIEHSAMLFVVTADRLHPLQIQPPPARWQPPISLSEIDSQLAGRDVLAAVNNPRNSPDDEIAFYTLDGDAAQLWRSTYAFDSMSFGMFESEPVDWMHEEAPRPSGIRAAWRDNANARDWLDGEPPCGTAPDDAFDAYVGFLTASRLHLQDVWYCDGYFRSVALSDAALPSGGFPEPSTIGAAVWHNGHLFVFRGE